MGKRKSRPMKQSMNAEAAAFHATALRQVANDLQQSINQVREPKASGDLDWARWVTGYTSSTLILRALATELMLKVLSYKRTGKFRAKGKEGHDLRILFDDLDEETRQLIDDLASAHGFRPLEQILEKHRGDFVNIRYLMMQDGQSRADLQDLDKAFSILTAVFYGERFGRLCASGTEL